MTTPSAPSVRIDRWLVAARIYKSRTIAQESCTAAQVLVNGQPVRSSHAVRVGDEVVYSTVPVRSRDVTATATRGDVSVTLGLDSQRSLLAAWVIPSLMAIGAVAAGVLIWLLAGRLARRLRGSITDLTNAAEAVEGGDLSVRAREGDETELGALARAFNEMAARLEAADMRQRSFLADVAHELRTPVTAIEGFAGALSDGTAATPEDRAEAAEFIREERPALIRMWVSDDVYQRVTAAARQVGTTQLKPIFILLGEKVSYDDIRLVVAHLAARDRREN